MAKPALSAYRAKRDFKITAEPSGAEAVPAADRLRFVIQKHDATRLHYDLRLEADGVFKSWAVTKGPSLDPEARRLAVEVEDHPLDYGDFEGVIPKGQYGGGTVMLWDRGYWAPEDGADPIKALKKGHLSFVMEGERMKGGWSLIRMKADREGSKRNNWLLIKHEDEAARPEDGDALLESATSVASGRPMEAIAQGRGKSPKPFVGVKRAKPVPDAVWSTADAHPRSSKSLKPAQAMPAFVEAQLCRSVDRPPPGDGWGHEIKFDGYRVQLRVEAGRVTLKTRKGLDWTERFSAIAKAARALPDCMVDGEVCALNADGAPDFPGLQAALSDGRTDDLIFFAFDLMFVEGQDLRDEPLSERKARLKTLLDGLAEAPALRLRYVDHFETAGQAVLDSACRMDLEGVVSKRLDAPYRSGRQDSWTKAKCRGGHEVVIGGWSGDGAQLRSLLVGVHRDGHLVYLGKVGTGFGRTTAEALMSKLKALQTKTSPFTGPEAPKRGALDHWARPVLVAEIAFAGWTGSGRLRQASFKGLREDKPPGEVQSESPAPVESVDLAEPKPKAGGPPRAKGAGPGNVVMGVTLSHPDKALWPDGGDGEPVTKADLARYYEAVAGWMIHHLKGRPSSIIRAPDGIGGQHFFQRHAMPGTSSLLTLTTVSGDKKPYLQVDRVEGLAALAQAGALEVHPWNCRPGQPEIPGRLVFDLDPAPDVAFDAVVRGALEIRRRLEALGLVAFCKTTGGKGLHVVTPLSPPAQKGPATDWTQAKAFARAVCQALADDAPDLYVMNMAKSQRKGRIFLDYLRNDRTATAVAPLSPRARLGAPVSMPLTWSQVKPGLDPMRFTLRTVPALLPKTKAWTDYDAGERSLTEAIKRLKAG